MVLSKTSTDVSVNLPTWDSLATYCTSTKENILHLLAKTNDITALLALLESKCWVHLKTLMIATNDNNETPFHLACKHLNQQLFEFIALRLSPKKLLPIAAIKNMDGEYNAFALVCIAGYEERITRFRAALQARIDLPTELLHRYPFGNIEMRDGQYVLMERFREIFGEGINNLYTSFDRFGNNALMLCCYTCQPVLIDACLKICADDDTLYTAATTCEQGVGMTPMKLLCGFANHQSVELLLNRLGANALRACVEEEALSWCYRTKVADVKIK
ncbi:MAG: hypothetical protein M3R00_08230, partial [Pseudomonadota bacterium]|nr:hypothetical protein [Pseudomonadota bacterium]